MLAKAVEIFQSMDAVERNAQQLIGNDLQVGQVRNRPCQPRQTQRESSGKQESVEEIMLLLQGNETIVSVIVVIRTQFVITVVNPPVHGSHPLYVVVLLCMC